MGTASSVSASLALAYGVVNKTHTVESLLRQTLINVMKPDDFKEPQLISEDTIADTIGKQMKTVPGMDAAAIGVTMPEKNVRNYSTYIADICINGTSAYWCINVMRNGVNLNPYFECLVNDSYEVSLASVVLDIETRLDTPRMPTVLSEQQYEKLAARHFTYIPSTKTLYKGGKIVGCGEPST